MSNRQVWSGVAAIALGLGVLGLVPPQAAPDQSVSVWREVRRTGKPLSTLIRPGDRELHVKGGAEPPLRVAPNPGETQIQQLVRLKNAAVIAEVISVRPHLTDEGDWIVTDVTLRVSEVVNSVYYEDLTVGAELPLVIDGGEVQIDRTKVKALNDWQRRPSVGEHYLLFVGKRPTGPLLGPGEAYRIDGEHLERLVVEGPPDEIARSRKADVLAAIRGGK